MFRLLSFAASCLVAAAMLGALTEARAGTIGVHVASMHFPERDFNNFNPGLYYRSDLGWTAGAYRNSLRQVSAYAGYTWERGVFGLTAGAVSGYAGNSVQPLLVPSMSVFAVHGATARLAFIPRVEKRIGSHVLHLMMEF